MFDVKTENTQVLLLCDVNKNKNKNKSKSNFPITNLHDHQTEQKQNILKTQLNTIRWQDPIKISLHKRIKIKNQKKYYYYTS
jgi:hypothetical protein